MSGSGVNGARVVWEGSKGFVYSLAVAQAMSLALLQAFLPGGLYADAFKLDLSDSQLLKSLRWAFFAGIFITYASGRAGTLIRAARKPGFDQSFNPLPIIKDNFVSVGLNIGPGLRAFTCARFYKKGDAHKRILLAKSLGNLSVAFVFGGSAALFFVNILSTVSLDYSRQTLGFITLLPALFSAYIGLIGFAAYQTDGLVKQVEYVLGAKKALWTQEILDCQTLAKQYPDKERVLKSIARNLFRAVNYMATAQRAQKLGGQSENFVQEQRRKVSEALTNAIGAITREKTQVSQNNPLKHKLERLQSKLKGYEGDALPSIINNALVEFVPDEDIVHKPMHKQHGLRRLTAKLNAFGYMARAYFSFKVALSYVFILSNTTSVNTLNVATFISSIFANSISPYYTGGYGRASVVLKAAHGTAVAQGSEAQEKDTACTVIASSWGALRKNVFKTPKTYSSKPAVWLLMNALRSGGLTFFSGMGVAVPQMFYSTVLGFGGLTNACFSLSSSSFRLDISGALYAAPLWVGVTAVSFLVLISLPKALYDTGHYNIGRAMVGMCKLIDESCGEESRQILAPTTASSSHVTLPQRPNMPEELKDSQSRGARSSRSQEMSQFSLGADSERRDEFDLDQGLGDEKCCFSCCV